MSVANDAIEPAADDATGGRLGDDETADVTGGIFGPASDGSQGIEVIG